MRRKRKRKWQQYPVNVLRVIPRNAAKCCRITTFMELYKNACNEIKTALELAYILWSGRYEKQTNRN